MIRKRKSKLDVADEIKRQRKQRRQSRKSTYTVSNFGTCQHELTLIGYIEGCFLYNPEMTLTVKNMKKAMGTLGARNFRFIRDYALPEAYAQQEAHVYKFNAPHDFNARLYKYRPDVYLSTNLSIFTPKQEDLSKLPERFEDLSCFLIPIPVLQRSVDAF